MNTKLLFKAIVTGLVAGVIAYGAITPLVINADMVVQDATATHTLIHNGHLTICMLNKSSYVSVKEMLMMTTSYNSDPRQTDDTPFITASGTHVHEGTVATNILPFGTKLKIEGFGDEIFTVEDRMNAKYDGKKMLDIWTANEKDSLDYGARIVTVKIVEI